MAYYVAVSILIISFFLLVNYTLLSVIYRKRIKPKKQNLTRSPKVSILKPVKYMDDGMEHNLETFYSLDYDNYEVIFGIDGFHQDCHDLLMRFRQKHANVPTKIVSTGYKKILNPKIDMLAKMEKEASGELLWVSDSNIRVEKNTLNNLVHEYLYNGSKIVFSPIRGMGGRTLGSIMENAYLNTFVSGNIMGAWKYLKKQIIVGKSMLIEKEALDKFGGFEYFREYLAEDFIMGETYVEHDLKISTNYTWVTNYSSHSTVASFHRRMSRWAKMRFHISKQTYLIEILANPIILSLLFFTFLGEQGLNLLIFSAITKLLFEYIVLFALNEEGRKNLLLLLTYPISIILKDFLLFFIYLSPFFSNKVTWRGWEIKIGTRSRIYT